MREGTGAAATIADLPNALRDGRPRLAECLAGRRLAVFLDYDGTLTPIVERPEDAVISDSMRDTVRELARRCPVCVVSGRDRLVVQRLMGIQDLVVAASHGFDIWDPEAGTVSHDAATGFEDLLSEVAQRLQTRVGSYPGAIVEVKRASVALHYRLVAEADHTTLKAVMDALLAEYPGQLKVTPGKMVYEIQPKLDWHKGRAVLLLLRVLGLDGDDVVPLYLGDDVTDEDAFRALAGRGIGIVVAGDPPDTGRPTAADFVLDSTGDVELFLNTLAR